MQRIYGGDVNRFRVLNALSAWLYYNIYIYYVYYAYNHIDTFNSFRFPQMTTTLMNTLESETRRGFPMRAWYIYIRNAENARIRHTFVFKLNIILNNAYRCFVITSIYYVLLSIIGVTRFRGFLQCETYNCSTAYNTIYM